MGASDELPTSPAAIRLMTSSCNRRIDFGSGWPSIVSSAVEDCIASICASRRPVTRPSTRTRDQQILFCLRIFTMLRRHNNGLLEHDGITPTNYRPFGPPLACSPNALRKLGEDLTSDLTTRAVQADLIIYLHRDSKSSTIDLPFLTVRVNERHRDEVVCSRKVG